MPSVPFEDRKGKVKGVLTFGGEYKPGDQPPLGYCDWHEWAEVQTKAGLKQRRSSCCSKWKFPQEIFEENTVEVIAYKTKRDAINEENPIKTFEARVTCNECANRKAVK